VVKQGHCGLCGKFKNLSFEHVPPQSAFNNKPIFIQHHEHLFDTTSFLYGKKLRSNKGFGGYTLCETCNNNTGKWYAKDFGDFVHQGMAVIQSLKVPQYAITGEYHIKPLNVLKQILTMFMSADKLGHLKSQKELVHFILDKEKTQLPENFKVFLYSTMSSFKRLIGHSVVYDPKLGIQKWCEINFQPYGYLLAEESGPAHEHMCDISDFGKYGYDQKVSVAITTAYLGVATPFIGDYR
jgi:hypothetical protein